MKIIDDCLSNISHEVRNGLWSSIHPELIQSQHDYEHTSFPLPSLWYFSSRIDILNSIIRNNIFAMFYKRLTDSSSYQHFSNINLYKSYKYF
jgi:hypothetical protein